MKVKCMERLLINRNITGMDRDSEIEMELVLAVKAHLL